MEDIEIKKALESIEVRPSAKCWQAIESGLPAAGTATAVAAKKGIFHLTSTATKIVVGSAAAAIVAAAITIPLLSKQPQDNVTPLETQIAAIDTTSVIAATSSESNVIESNNTTSSLPNASDEQTITVKESTDLVSTTPNENAPITPNVVTPSTQNTISTQQTTSPPKSTPTNNNVAHSNTTNTQPKQPTTTQRIIKDDPVLTENTVINESQPVSITIPNVFTPNGDGVNDQFIILGIEDCEQHRLIIKNRAGKIVYQSTQYHNDWTAEGLPEGAYFYQFAYKVNGIEEVRSGALTILR